MNFVNKTFKLNVNIIDHRIWLPKELQEDIKKYFLNIKIRNVSFITKITKDGRFFIPKELTQQITNGINEIEVTILNNLQRTKHFFHEGMIDVLAFVPEKTMSGFDILALEEKDNIRLWYSTKGRPNEIVIKRYLPNEFILLLGYYQAEGGKAKLSKRRGRELNFTNSDFVLIEDFVKLLFFLIDKKLYKATLRYNNKLSQEEINDVINKLCHIGIKKENISVKTADRIREYTIKIWISNSIIGESINNMMNKIRKYLCLEKNKKFIVYFLKGLIAGDGCFCSVRDKAGSLHSNLLIYENNFEFINDYQKIFKNIGLNGKIRKDKIKNLYIFSFFVNWNLLLHVLNLGLLDKSLKNQKKLAKSIREHKLYKFGWLKDEKIIEKLKNIEK